MLTRDQVKQKWIEIIESVHKEKVFSSVEGAWQLAQWVESQYQESDVYLALLGQVNAAITFDTEEQARESKYGLPPDLAQAIYLALTRGFFPSKQEPKQKPLKIPNKPRIRFVNNGDVSIRIRQTDHTYDDLVILDMRLEDKGFGWFIEQVLMEEESQTEPRYFPTLKATIDDAIDYIKIGNYVEWENYIPLIQEFMEVNQWHT